MSPPTSTRCFCWIALAPHRQPFARSRRNLSQSGTVGWYKRTDTLKQQSFVSRRDRGNALTDCLPAGWAGGVQISRDL